VTASFGIAELHRGEANKNQLIAAADTALYEAKRRGKNRTVKARLVRSAPAGPA
jgi:PleD family two-component response regulator